MFIFPADSNIIKGNGTVVYKTMERDAGYGDNGSTDGRGADDAPSFGETNTFCGDRRFGNEPLAEILHSRGYTITGSDVNPSDNVDRMTGLGIPVAMPQAAENVGDAELVVYTSAVHAENPELQEAQRRGLPLIERGSCLSLSAGITPIPSGWRGRTEDHHHLHAVADSAAGWAGPPSSSAAACSDERQRPGRGAIPSSAKPAISGTLPLHDSGGFGDSERDADHLDYFRTLENVIASFHRFAGLASRAVIANHDDANTRKAVEGIDPKSGYGSAPAPGWNGCPELPDGGRLLRRVRSVSPTRSLPPSGWECPFP